MVLGDMRLLVVDGSFEGHYLLVCGVKLAKFLD